MHFPAHVIYVFHLNLNDQSANKLVTWYAIFFKYYGKDELQQIKNIKDSCFIWACLVIIKRFLFKIVCSHVQCYSVLFRCQPFVNWWGAHSPMKYCCKSKTKLRIGSFTDILSVCKKWRLTNWYRQRLFALKELVYAQVDNLI